MILDPIRFRACFAALGAVSAVVACNATPAYPRCDTDMQCSAKDRHDYCVAGSCVYCRDATDCGPHQACQVGKCVEDTTYVADAGPPTQATDDTFFPRKRRRYYPSME